MGIKISQFMEGKKGTPDAPKNPVSQNETQKASSAQNVPAETVRQNDAWQNPSQLSANETKENNLQVIAFNKTIETYPKDNYKSAEWQDIKPAENKIFGIQTGGYTYTTSDGTKIKLDDIDGVIVKQNSKTGEIVLAGLNDASIKGSSKDVKLTIYDSILDEISLGSGHDNLSIYNCEIEKIDTGKGNDKINLENATVKDALKGGSGDDYIQIKKSNVSTIKGDDGKDNILLDNSTAGEVLAGADNDVIAVESSKIYGKLQGDKGDDIINVSKSNIEVLDGSKGADNIIVDDSDVKTLNSDKNDIVNSAKQNAKISSIETLDEQSINEANNIIKTKTSGYNHTLTPEEEVYAVTVDFFENNLNNIKTQFDEQEKEDGAVSDAYNWVKQLTNLGVSKDDINSAIEEQEKMVQDMKDAINGKGDKSFEEVFKEYTGTQYNEDNVADYLETSQIYSLALTGLVKSENFKQQITKASNLGEVAELYTNYYGSEELGREKLNELLQETFTQNPMEFGYPSSVEINENNELVIKRPKEYGAMGPVDGTEYETTVEDISEVTNMMNTMGGFFNLDRYSEEFTNTMEKTIGRSLEELQNEYASKQLKTFGKGNSFQKLIDRYCEDQNGFKDKLASTVQVCGLGMMAAGGIICIAFPPASAAGVGLMNAGKYTAYAGTFGDNLLDLVDDISSENKISKDEAYGLAKESITELALLYSGRQINGIAAGVKGEVLNATQSKTLAFLSQIGTDASLSLLTDLMITGEVNLTGEGISQLLGIITGLAGARVDAYTKEKTGTQNLDSANKASAADDIDVKPENKLELPKEKITELSASDKSYADKFNWDNTQRSQYLELLNQGIDQFDAKMCVHEKFSAAQISDYTRLVNSGTDSTIALEGVKAGWNGEQFELCAKLEAAGMYDKDTVDCINNGWDLAKCNKYAELTNKGIDTIFAQEALQANWTDKHWKAYSELSNYVGNEYTLNDMHYKFDMNWSADEFSNFVTLKKSGIDTDVAAKGIKSNWSADHWNTYAELMKYSKNALELGRITDKIDFEWSVDELSGYTRLIKSGQSAFDASAKIKGASAPKKEYKLSIDQNTGKQNLDAEMFFVNVDGYGRDLIWGTKMAQATENTSELVSAGAEYTEIVSFFVNETKQIQSDAANPEKNQTGRSDAAMMNNYGRLKNIDEKLMTPMSTGRYSYFLDKLIASSDTGGPEINYAKSSQEFPLASTTRISINTDTGNASLWHPAGCENFKYAESVYNDLRAMDNPSPDVVIDSVAKMHWLMAQNTPFARGSDSISSGVSKAILRSYGIEVSPLKEGISVDFEAFSTNMEDFVKNYRSFYVSEPKKIN